MLRLIRMVFFPSGLRNDKKKQKKKHGKKILLKEVKKSQNKHYSFKRKIKKGTQSHLIRISSNLVFIKLMEKYYESHRVFA